MSLTSEQYVKSGGLLCPCCGEKAIERDSMVEVDGDSAYQKVHCTECGQQWYDLYKLTGYEPA